MIVDKKISVVIFGLEIIDVKVEFIVFYMVGVSFMGNMNVYLNVYFFFVFLIYINLNLLVVFYFFKLIFFI